MELEDTQKPIFPRKVELRVLQNGTRNINVQHKMDSSSDNVKCFNVDFSRISAVKRPHTDFFCEHINDGQSDHQQMKIENEPFKASRKTTCTIDDEMYLQNLVEERSNSKDECTEESMKHVDSLSTFIPVPIPAMGLSCNSTACSTRSPITGFSVAATATDYSCMSSGVPFNSQATNLHWKERFLRLQEFLKAYDQSNQEDYIRMLRSLTAAGRSKHAVELEKRAIRLLLEEGRELNRMKVLNVFNGSSVDKTPQAITANPSGK